MQVITLEKLNIEEIVASLKEGQVIVYPTETVYGLGCDATNAAGVEKVFQIKQRQRNKPVLVVAGDESMMMQYVQWTPTLEKISSTYWPGPLTVVAQTKRGVTLPDGVVAGDGTIAFRITNHHIAKEISEALGKPLVSTSANISSQVSPSDIDGVLSMFEHSDVQPDILIDAGTLPHRTPSTIVRVTNETVEVLRQGEVVVNL